MIIKRHMLNKLGVITLSATMLAGGLAPSISFAKESTDEPTTNGISIEYQSSIDLVDLEASMLVQKFSEANENNLAVQSSTTFNNVDFTNAGTTTQVGNETVQTITDAEMLNLLEKSGVKIPDEAKRQASLRGAGTTKVVWSGAKSKGNVKIYASKVTLCAIQGLKVAVAMVGFIGGLIGQNYAVVALSAMQMIASTIKVGSIKHGRIYTISGWKYKGVVNQ